MAKQKALTLNLTTLRNLKKVKKDTVHTFTGSDRGIRLRQSPTGKKTWVIRYTLNGKGYPRTVGHFDNESLSPAPSGVDPTALSIEQVRTLHRRYKQLASQGIDPTLVKENPIDETAGGTVRQLIDVYLHWHTLKGTAPENLRNIENSINYNIGELEHKLVREVVPNDIRDIKQIIIDRGAPSAADSFKSYIQAAFGIAVYWDDVQYPNKPDINFGISVNPCATISDKYAIVDVISSKSTRNLSFDEIHALVNSPDIPQTMILRIKLILSMGQRIKQVLLAPMSEIDFEGRTWTWTADRMKNKRGNKKIPPRPHAIPLTDFHIDLIKQCYALVGSKGEYLFPKNNNPKNGPVTSYTNIRGVLSEYCKKNNVEHFNPSDLRRTFKTRGGQIGLAKDALDKVQHHSVGDVSNRVYNQYEYMTEKLETLNVWCDKLEEVFKS